MWAIYGRRGPTTPAPQTTPAAQAKPSKKTSAPATKTRPGPVAKQAANPKAAPKRTPPPAKPKAAAREQAVRAPRTPSVIAGQRDPFKLPPAPVPGGGQGQEITGPLPPGTRGLVISQLRLEGIVRLDETNTMIAVVTSFTNRAYFLRENDAVFNGIVSKITLDAVYFNENYLDPFGRVSTREVVKRLGSAVGEGR